MRKRSAVRIRNPTPRAALSPPCFFHSHELSTHTTSELYEPLRGEGDRSAGYTAPVKVKSGFHLDVAQLTERRIWDAEAVGLSPTIQTKPPIGILMQIRHNMMDFAFAAVPPLAGIGRRKSAIG